MQDSCTRVKHEMGAFFFIATQIHSVHKSCMSERQHKAEVGLRLRQAIQATHPTFVAWCKEYETFGADKHKLGNWMRGDHYPSPYLLSQYCSDYGLTMDYFYRNIPLGVASSVAERLKAPKPA